MDRAAEFSEGHREVASVLRDLAWTIHRRIPEAAGLLPLPNTELAVLKHVLDQPGLTVTELSRLLGLRPPNTSAAVRTLTERGLLLREPDPGDRRVTHLLPTEKALAGHEAVVTAWSGAIQRALAQLPTEQVAALEAATDALRALDQVTTAQQGHPVADQAETRVSPAADPR